jgi:phage shock protein E
MVRDISHPPRWLRRPDRLAGAIAAGLLALGGCGSSAAEPATDAAAESAPSANGGVVSVQRAAELAADPTITVIDVRTPEEFAQGHLAGAAMIDFQSSAFAEDVAALDPSGRYLVYCRSGNRSAQAVTLMRELGFDEVYDMEGGIVAWSGADLPVER